MPDFADSPLGMAAELRPNAMKTKGAESESATTEPARLPVTTISSLLKPANLVKAFRFGVVGGVVLLIDLGLVHLLNPWFPSLLTVSIAYVIAVTVHFLLNKFWVFKCSSQAYGSQILRYLVNLVACWLSTVALVYLALRWITPHLLVAKLIAVPPTTLLAYALLRWFVFNATAAASNPNSDCKKSTAPPTDNNCDPRPQSARQALP